MDKLKTPLLVILSILVLCLTILLFKYMTLTYKVVCPSNINVYKAVLS